MEKISCAIAGYPQNLPGENPASEGNEYNPRPQNLLNKKRIDARYISRGFNKPGGFQDNNNYWSSLENNSNNAWNANGNSNGNVNNNNDNKNNNNSVRCAHYYSFHPGLVRNMETIFTKEKIFNAYLDCRKTKKNTANALKFEINREKNLFKLLRELQRGTYKISRHICFIVTEPKPREIFAADFRDRVVHHLLCNEIYELFEKDFIENSFANRVDKGTHKGVQKLKEYLKEKCKSSNYLKLDIKSFFCSINKDILYKIVYEKIIKADKPDCWKKEILWLCKMIIYHDPTTNYIFRGDGRLKSLIPKEKSLFYSNGKGLPIGNLTSQFFANVYLDKLDHFIYSLGFKYYVRYVDDFIVLGDRKILYELPKIKAFLKEKLDLKLSEKKVVFQSTKIGIDFLGYYIKPSHILVRRKVVARFRSKLNFLDFADAKKTLATINSYFGHFSHADSYKLRKYSCKRLAEKLSNKFVFKDKYSHLNIHPVK